MKWEYFVKDIGADFHPPSGQTKILNHYGDEGWELVGLLSAKEGSFAYFKRPIKEEIPVYKDGVKLEKSRIYNLKESI